MRRNKHTVILTKELVQDLIDEIVDTYEIDDDACVDVKLLLTLATIVIQLWPESFEGVKIKITEAYLKEKKNAK
jgi:hypothetical protein